MTVTSDKILTLHPAGKQGVNIDRDKYDEMKRAILKVVGRGKQGLSFTDMSRLVKPLLSKPVYGKASTGWYCVTVKLDLEARGILERVPKTSPQLIRRA